MVGVTGGLLSKRALLLAKIETTPGTDALPVPALDAILVADPEFSIDPNILERDFVSSDLSPFEHIIGRKLASITFTTDGGSPRWDPPSACSTGPSRSARR